MPRDAGYYWVRDDRERWVVALWNGASWQSRTAGGPLGGVAEVGSRIPDEQVPTHWLSALTSQTAARVKTAGTVVA